MKPKIPLTREHLLAACDWARQATEPVQIANTTRAYYQPAWDCGTACCLHGAAHLIARGRPTTQGPSGEDYADLGNLRGWVLRLLYDENTTPAELLALLIHCAVNLPEV